MSLSKIFGQITPKKVLLAGDLLLDTYTIGDASRISPEAPVPVVRVREVFNLPGGAGNVALNCRSLGLDVVALGRIGDDSSGEQLKQLLAQEGIDTSGIVTQEETRTPIKNRMIAGNQQMVRIDYEDILPLSARFEKEVTEAIPRLLKGVDVALISDYGKGFLTDKILRVLIDEARCANIPVLTDPKGADFSKYAHSSVIKPNLKEAEAASGLGPHADFDTIGRAVLKNSRCDELLITRSEKGISYFPQKGPRQDFPVKVREVKDVTGAGDTVLAVIAFALAHCFPMELACRLSNVAAGLAVEVLGCARITLGQLAARLLEEDSDNKIFSDEHFHALEMVLAGKKLTLLGIEKDTALSADLFKTIRTLSVSDRDLMVYLRDGSPCEELVHILSSLKNVHYIIQNPGSFQKLCHMIKPSDIYVYGGQELKKLDQVTIIEN